MFDERHDGNIEGLLNDVQRLLTAVKDNCRHYQDLGSALTSTAFLDAKVEQLNDALKACKEARDNGD